MDNIGNNLDGNNTLSEQNNIEEDIVISDENFLDSFVMPEVEKTEKLEDRLIKRMLDFGLRVRLKKENNGLRPFYSIDENKTPLLKVGYERLLDRAKDSHRRFSERYLNSSVRLVSSREEALSSVMETLIEKGKLIEKYCVISNSQLDRVVSRVKDAMTNDVYEENSLDVIIDKSIKMYNPIHQFGILSKITSLVRKKEWRNVDFSNRMQANESIWRNNIDMARAEVDRLLDDLVRMYEDNDCIENELLFMISFKNLLASETQRVNELNESIETINHRNFVGEDQEVENEDVFVKSMWEKLLWEVEKEKNMVTVGHDRKRKYQFLDYLDAYSNEVLSGESEEYIKGRFAESVPISIRGLCRFVYDKAREKASFAGIENIIRDGGVDDEVLGSRLEEYFNAIDLKEANIDIVKECVLNMIKMRSVEIFVGIENIEDDENLFWPTVKSMLGREDMDYEQKIRFMEMVYFLVNNKRPWGEGLPFSEVNNLIDYALRNKNKLKKQKTIELVERTINAIGKMYADGRRENDRITVGNIRDRYNRVWSVCDGYVNEKKYQMYIWK